MINSNYQLKGIGSSIIGDLTSYLKCMAINYIRLGYVKSNIQIKSFWFKNGFLPTGIESENEKYTVVVLERSIHD